MARPSLNVLYQASLAQAFARAVTTHPLDTETHAFLCEHADELGIVELIKFFDAERSPECREQEGPLVRRLAALLPSAGDGRLLEVLRSSKMDAVLWIEDVVLPLRGRLVPWKWYRFVDGARGGAVFNALQQGVPIPSHERGWDPASHFVRSIEERRAEPFVATLLHCAHDDAECAKRALEMLPIHELLAASARLERDAGDRSSALSLEVVRNAIARRVSRSDERWILEKDTPQWMASLVIERLAQRDWSGSNACHEEAASLYEWLAAQPAECHRADLYEFAFAQLKKHPFEIFWQEQIGARLASGSAWKKRGYSLLAFCADLNSGLPLAAIAQAINAAGNMDGATVEEHRSAILKAVHNESARLFLERAESALVRRDYADVSRFLTAFLSLDADSRLGTRIRALQKTRGNPDEIGALLEACMDLARAGGREPSIDGVRDAFLALGGQR